MTWPTTLNPYIFALCVLAACALDRNAAGKRWIERQMYGVIAYCLLIAAYQLVKQ